MKVFKGRNLKIFIDACGHPEGLFKVSYDHVCGLFPLLLASINKNYSIVMQTILI